MAQISGYRIEERLDETLYSVIYRARASEKDDMVIIKALKAEHPTPAEIARLKHEYELIRGINIDGVVNVLDIIDVQGGLAIVMEDFGGVSLKEVLRGGFSLQRFLELAVRLAEILGQLHQQGISHRDIKPGNILINQDKDILKLTDFGIASEFTRQNEQIYNLKVMEGTLAYISPEQTGRINCAVDYRTDLYSLGVSFYEMLTGNLPFLSSDPMEIIHAHIAKIPLSPSQIKPTIPQMVSSVVMKLMAKPPDERYQNSFGLRYDLEECLNRLKQSDDIAPFEVGRHDVSLRFNIPQMIVGRDKELILLKDAFDRVNAGSKEIMLVAGEPGIGKSALVGELHRPIIEKHGYYLSGKYDPLRRNVPYSAIIQAFTALAKQLLSESEETLSEWRKWFLASLGPNGKIVVDAIPEMGNIIGPQPDIPELGPEETQNRFQLVMKNFVRVFSAQGHPLVMFLDDLQWADSASLELLKIIAADPNLTHFLLIGTYRDTETPAHHPFMLALDEMRKSMVVIQTVSLHQLDAASVNILIANFLRVEPQMSEPLSKIIHAKTLGNPFFVIQFLKTLFEDKYLVLDASSQWKWDIHVIEQLQVTDNVVELMAAKIARLPNDQQELIEVCACIGNRFDIETLSDIMERPLEELLSTMDALIQGGLINYGNNLYRFHHDRIQEAAYSLIEEADRRKMHYKIGKRLLETTPVEQMIVKVFYIADQFNRAHALLKPEDKESVADLNLKAGLKAKESTAYAAAADYLKAGMELLPDRPWEVKPQLTFTFYYERMECAYLNYRFEEAEALFAEIIHNSKNRVECAKAYYTMITLNTNRGKLEEAISLGLESLRMFGLRLNRNPSKFAVARELIHMRIKLKKIGIENLENLPMSKDTDEKSWKVELYAATNTPAFYVNPLMFALGLIKAINLDLDSETRNNGSSFGFMALAIIIGSQMGDYKSAYRLAETALNLSENDDKRYACKSPFTFAFLIMHWFRPLSESIDFYRKAYQLGLESGDFIYCGHCVNSVSFTRIAMGDYLEEILAEHNRYKDFMLNVKDPVVTSTYDEIRQLCLNLTGRTKAPDSLDTDAYSFDEHLSSMRAKGYLLNVFIMLFNKQEINYLAGQYEAAHQAGYEADTLLETTTGSILLPEHHFFRSLSLLAACMGKSTLQRLRILAKVKIRQIKMKRWSKQCSANYLHKYLLIEAETAMVQGRFEKAVRLYHQAIQSAHEHGFVSVEAIANERAALFYLGQGYEELARAYMTEAYYAYNRRGVTMKLRLLEQTYPNLIMQEARAKGVQNTEATIGTTSMGMTSTSNLLDLSTVMQTSQAISSEIVLDRLMQKIMKIAVVNAGAQSGYILLDNNGQLTIEAALAERAEEGRVMNSLPIEKSEELSKAIVNYVHRSQQNLILANAIQEGGFIDDPYIRRKKCKSILCAPILSKGKLSGIIYMENNLIANAFTPERLELLRIILSQAAISLENAKLFELATTDGLTKLYVHRYFQLLLDSELQRFERYRRPLSLIMLDIDNFKCFNDTYGHQLGDAVLRSVAHTVKNNTRKTDFVARYGGEEFVVIMPETNTTGAMAAAEKICAAVAAVMIPHGEEKLYVTISLGVASLPIHASDKESLIRTADEALYVSKRLGKNRASVAGTTFVPHQN